LEDGLNDNLRALFEQEYPAYEIVFVTDHPDDPSLQVIRETIRAGAGRGVDARIVIADEAVDCGQKVHNLKTAVTEANPRSEVLVFVDSDARPHSLWLKSLVSPLVDGRVGAATGYRWFVPAKGNLASHLRSVWNASIASALGARVDKNFCWGGSTAIRRATFDNLHIADAWKGTVSDDFAMTRVLQQAKLPISFVPDCLVPSIGDCTFAELMEFTNRQLKITCVYAPHLWRPLLIGSLLFTAVFFGGMVLVAVRMARGQSFLLALIMLLVIFVLGSAKSLIRFRAVARVLERQGVVHAGIALAHVILWPLASALYLWNALVAGFSRRIEWRGITYELKSPNEAVIIRRQ
jgi:cellulose synthase/poly-beta-1,6-N-acetylglucosamine synthase-like glycosyltransferase